MQSPSHGPWLSDDGPDTDVVMSCRVRLARNIAGFPFVGRASDIQRSEVLTIARQVVLATDLADTPFASKNGGSFSHKSQ